MADVLHGRPYLWSGGYLGGYGEYKWGSSAQLHSECKWLAVASMALQLDRATTLSMVRKLMSATGCRLLCRWVDRKQGFRRLPWRARMGMVSIRSWSRDRRRRQPPRRTVESAGSDSKHHVGWTVVRGRGSRS